MPVSRRSVLKGAALLGGTAALAGCGSDGTSPAGTTSEPIRITDQRGRAVVFSGPVQRVVTVPIPAASMLIAIDQSAERLVGMQDASWTAIHDGILGRMFPGALAVAHDVADQEFAPNVESILALDPDVVVQWGDHGDAVITPLENAGLTVVGLSYGTQSDLATWIRLFAAMLGKPARGQQILGSMNAELDQIRSAAAQRTGRAPTILYFLRYADGLQVAGTDTYNDFSVSLVGGTNAATSSGALPGFATVDIEQVLSWDPDIVLLGNFDDAMPADVYGDRVWQAVSAVKSRRVYKVPFGGYRWDPPGQESPLMWRWLSDVAFPGAARSDLRGRITASYRFLYGQEPTTSQIDQILWSDANADSASYQQFEAG